jgi:hypothetical protein
MKEKEICIASTTPTLVASSSMQQQKARAWTPCLHARWWSVLCMPRRVVSCAPMRARRSGGCLGYLLVRPSQRFRSDSGVRGLTWVSPSTDLQRSPSSYSTMHGRSYFMPQMRMAMPFCFVINCFNVEIWSIITANRF